VLENDPNQRRYAEAVDRVSAHEELLARAEQQQAERDEAKTETRRERLQRPQAHGPHSASEQQRGLREEHGPQPGLRRRPLSRQEAVPGHPGIPTALSEPAPGAGGLRGTREQAPPTPADRGRRAGKHLAQRPRRAAPCRQHGVQTLPTRGALPAHREPGCRRRRGTWPGCRRHVSRRMKRGARARSRVQGLAPRGPPDPRPSSLEQVQARIVHLDDQPPPGRKRRRS
jgi:hypothetical protein